MSFVLLFRTPFAAGIIMIVSQSTYALYVIFALRFTKLRYYIINVIGNCLVACLMAACFLTGFSPIESSTWQVGTTCYIVLLLSLVSLLVISLTLEILIRRDIIIKQLNSLVHRFILCDRIDENITKSKFDKDGHR